MRERERESLTPDIEWKTVKLKDIATFINGMAFKPSDWSENGKPIIRIQNLTGNTSNNYYNGIVDKKYEISDGDIIFSWSATIDAFIYKGQDAILNQHLFKVIPNNINKEFLYYILKNNVDKLKELSHGVSMKHIKKGDIENYVVSIPKNEKEQKKIAQVLSDLDELSKLHSLKVDELSKMKEHLMDNKSGIIENERNKQENNEWGELKLSEIFDTRNGYTPSKQVQEYWENGDIPWFRIEDIRENGHILNDSLQHINKLGVKGSGLFPENSIILSTSATIGEHALIKVPCLTNQRFVCFSLKKDMQEKFDIEYLYWYFYIIGNWCRENAIQGSTFLSVDIPMLKEQTIKFPKSISEQKRIAKMLSEYDSMVANQEKIISIIQREREFIHQTPQIIIQLLSGKQ